MRPCESARREVFIDVEAVIGFRFGVTDEMWWELEKRGDGREVGRGGESGEGGGGDGEVLGRIFEGASKLKGLQKVFCTPRHKLAVLLAPSGRSGCTDEVKKSIR